MINPINVYDDIIPNSVADYFETLIFGTSESVEINPVIDFKVKREVTAVEGEFSPVSFKHILKSSAETSSFLTQFDTVPRLICEHNRIWLQDILAARIFITVPYKTESKHMAKHTDFPFKHGVIIYYVNDADGDTVFFDDNDNIIAEVTPKKGRAVLFDGKIMHSGGIPKNGPRCIINYNIIT